MNPMNPEYESSYDAGEEYVFNWKLILVVLMSVAMWGAIVSAIVVIVK